MELSGIDGRLQSLYLSDHRAGTRHGLFQLVERIREGISLHLERFVCLREIILHFNHLSLDPFRFNRELIFQLLIF